MNLNKGVMVLIIMLIGMGGSVAQVPPPPPPPGLPINGFSELLLLIGIVYGAKKILKNNR